MKLSATGAVILASGLSERFGKDNKLLAMFGDAPLAQHSAYCVASLNIAPRIAVTPPGEAALQQIFETHGFECVLNPAPQRGRGRALALAADYLKNSSKDGFFVCLADMPLISPDMLARLAEAMDGAALKEGACVMSGDGARRSPPALFSAPAFKKLARLDGDRGAKTALDGRARIIEAAQPAWRLRDIDTPADLAAAAAFLGRNA